MSLRILGSVAKLDLADNGQFWSFKMFSRWNFGTFNVQNE